MIDPKSEEHALVFLSLRPQRASPLLSVRPNARRTGYRADRALIRCTYFVRYSS